MIGSAVKAAALTVYDKIDAIKVTPIAGMARVGGIQFPKQFQQFEAIAYHNGADGKPRTRKTTYSSDGSVDVAWSDRGVHSDIRGYRQGLRGQASTIRDSSRPNVDGPNPKRRGNGNNIGDVWVIATYKTADGRTLRARAHLLVTVPLYIRYDQPEVAQ